MSAEQRRECIAYLKQRFERYREPPLVLPAEHVIEDVVDFILAKAEAERERILAILRAVSPNAGRYCKLLLAELIAAIEGESSDESDELCVRIHAAE